MAGTAVEAAGTADGGEGTSSVEVGEDGAVGRTTSPRTPYPYSFRIQFLQRTMTTPRASWEESAPTRVSVS